MKKLFITILGSLLFQVVYSQEVSVSKSVYGVQTGFLGIWVHNEAKLSSEIVLRSEMGFDSGIWAGEYYDKTGFLLAPVISLEPRWYYSLERRLAKSKNINKNSGNFLAVKTSYHPDWFVISNYDSVDIISDVSIIPTWGIKRTIGDHFTYEVGAGIGYRHIFAKQAGYLNNESEVALNLHLRIGYSL